MMIYKNKAGKPLLLQRKMRLMKRLDAGISAVHAKISAFVGEISKKTGHRKILQRLMCVVRNENCVAALSKQFQNKIIFVTKNKITRVNQKKFALPKFFLLPKISARLRA